MRESLSGAAFDRLLSGLDCGPVLIDIGASGAPPAIWRPIAPHSVYVGFDPDLRDMQQTTGQSYSRSIIINEAVAADTGRTHAHFYFTKSPPCSSTLKPDAPSLAEYPVRRAPLSWNGRPTSPRRPSMRYSTALGYPASIG